MRNAIMINSLQETARSAGIESKRLLRPLLLVVAIAWLIEILDRVFFGGALNNFGIVPRQLYGLRGIIFAPWLHGSFAHLLANTVPFIMLGFLVMLRHPRDMVKITFTILLISGIGTWLVAPANTVHIGASGLIFGYFAYLVVNAWYERSLPAVLISVIVIVVYGGLLAGILPTSNGVSWESHLFGFVGGIVAATRFSRRKS